MPHPLNEWISYAVPGICSVHPKDKDPVVGSTYRNSHGPVSNEDSIPVRYGKEVNREISMLPLMQCCVTNYIFLSA